MGSRSCRPVRSAIGAWFSIKKPGRDYAGLNYVFATGGRQIGAFREILRAIPAEFVARLRFSEEDVRSLHGEFLARSVYDAEEDVEDPRAVQIAPEGRVILVFVKPASHR
jgi:hypothetical protein